MALEIFQKRLGRAHLEYSTTLSNLAMCLKQQGRFEEAIGHYRECEELQQAVKARGVLVTLKNLASCQYAARDFSDALETFERVRESPKAKPTDIVAALWGQAACLRALGDTAAAIKSLEECLDIEAASKADSTTTLTKLRQYRSSLLQGPC